MDVDQQDVIITLTRNKHSLTPIAVEELTTLQDLRLMIDKLTSLDKARLLYINEEGSAVALESNDEYTNAVGQANKTKQLHLLIEDIEKQPKERRHHHGHHDHHHHGHCHHGYSHKRHYSQLAACIGEKRKRAAEYAAKTLLGKSQSMDLSEEPEWFKEAMKKYTQTIIAEVKGQTGPEEEGSARKKECSSDKVIHRGVVCDYCEKEIAGIRYKCGNCVDFDLCENCESFSEYFHEESHVFIKIKKPAPRAGVNKKGKYKPLLKKNIYKDQFVVLDVTLQQQGSSSMVIIDQPLVQQQQRPKDELFIIGDDPLVVPPVMMSPPPTLPLKQDEESVKVKKPAPSLIRRSKKQLREDLKKTTREEPLHINSQEDMIRYSKKQLRELKAARQKKRKEQGEVQGAGNGGPVMMESLESSSSIQKGHGKCLDSKFVVDGNIPDGSVIMYGKAFSKSWIIQNTGSKTWRNVQLVHQDGFLPIQREVDVPALAPGQQENVSVDYPAISPEDGSNIKSSWRLVHNKTTPFGCTLWLSCQLKPDPIDELTLSFEQIKYPVFEEEDDEEEEEEEEETQQCQGDNSSESSYSFVDPPSPPVLSYQSCRDDEEDCSDDDCSDDEFVVVIPDCFKLDKPLEGFTPDGTTPVSEDPPPVQLQQEQVQPSLSPTPSPPSTPPPPPFSPPVVSQPGKSSQTLPKPIPKREGDACAFVPDRIRLTDAWMSRSRNPLTYAVGLINTVSDLAEQHIPTVSPKTTPSAPPPPEEDSIASGDISKLIHQEPDTSRFIKKKWEEPKPATPMAELISMGFANRALNSRLLKKHGNDVELVLNELLETNGDGYHDVISCSFS